MNDDELLSQNSELRTQNLALPLHGLLNIAKPARVSSRHVVTQIEHALKPITIGHAGTLDPMATGVLLVCVGRGTKLVDYLHRFSKTYLATFLLGRKSDTEDVTGIVEPLVDPPRPTREELEKVLPQFRGEVLQQPPVFSALKIDGKRAYKMARRGRTVQLEMRPIVIKRLEITRYEYPELQLDIECGSGTYIRSLGRDIARAVGTEAIMSALSRTSIGPFQLANATRPEDVRRDNAPSLLQPALLAITSLPRVEITQLQAERLGATGVSFDLSLNAGEFSAGAEVAAIAPDGRLFAIITPSKGDRWKLKSFLG
jgi:tRNA pseudouridine55 synthase